MNVQHACSEFIWKLALNEEGWHCVDCGNSFAGEPGGYAPFFDKENIDEKVGDILHELHESGVIYISNGSSGDVLTAMIANRCRNENRFDQEAIIHFYFDLTWRDHSDYWRKIGMGIREGRDPRERCECGALATHFVSDSEGKHEYCSGCYMKRAA